MALGCQILIWRIEEEEYHGFPELGFQCETIWAGKLKTGPNTVVGLPAIPVQKIPPQAPLFWKFLVLLYQGPLMTWVCWAGWLSAGHVTCLLLLVAELCVHRMSSLASTFLHTLWTQCGEVSVDGLLKNMFHQAQAFELFGSVIQRSWGLQHRLSQILPESVILSTRVIFLKQYLFSK